MTKEAGWNIHHVIERHKGGSDKMDNLVLLHPNCHRKLHFKISCFLCIENSVLNHIYIHSLCSD